jgi:GntR family transcriptional regulator, mannosyl-D-glycerate transport/metabolism system repressor
MTVRVAGKQKDVIDYLLEKIKSQYLAPGDKLDTEVSISKAIGVTRATVREATRYLVDNNIIYRVKGSGLYVGAQASKLSQAFHHALSPFDTQAESKGVEANRKVLSVSLVEVPSIQIAHALKLKPSDKVFYIERLMLFGTKPVALEKTCIPMTVLSDIELNEIEKSKYAYIESKTGKLIKTREQDITAFNLEDEVVSQLLDVSLGQAMIELQEVVYFDDGSPSEYNIAIINSDLFNLHQITKRD